VIHFRGKRGPVICGLLVLAAITFFGVNGGTARVISVAPRDGTEAREQGPKVGVAPAVEVLSDSAASCSDGSVALGTAPGEVDIRVSCHGTKSSPASFLVGLYDGKTGRQDPEGVLRVQRHPKVVSATGDSRKTMCRLRRGIVSCRFAARGAFVAQARLWVKPGEECSQSVGVYLVRPAKCYEGFCELSMNARYLTKERPSGCLGS
jgi:hypothetical protein